MKVNLTYYKPSGKYYSEGSYVTSCEHMFEIFDEVKILAESKRLPDLVNGAGPYYVTVDVPAHPHSHPALIIPKVLRND